MITLFIEEAKRPQETSDLRDQYRGIDHEHLVRMSRALFSKEKNSSKRNTRSYYCNKNNHIAKEYVLKRKQEPKQPPSRGRDEKSGIKLLTVRVRTCATSRVGDSMTQSTINKVIIDNSTPDHVVGYIQWPTDVASVPNIHVEVQDSQRAVATQREKLSVLIWPDYVTWHGSITHPA